MTASAADGHGEDGVRAVTRCGGFRPGWSCHLRPAFRLLLTLGALGLLLSAAPSPAQASPAQVSPDQVLPAPVLYLVHLGDIWRYDDESGAAAIAVSAEGKAIGHPSWSLDDSALAWEEREMAAGQRRSRVVFRGPPDLPSGQRIVWAVEGASSPAVSPDGRYLLYQRVEGASPSLHVVDTAGEPVLSILDARNGCWATSGTGVWPGSGAGLLIAFDRADAPSASNPGFWLHELATGTESSAPVTNAWAPQAGTGRAGFLVTAYAEGGDQVRVARIVGGAAETLLDVTDSESFDYRWLRGHGGDDVPYLELVPMAGGRSDIYRVVESAGQPGPELALLASSFGWNASLPARSPFSDLGRADSYYQAAVCLWANQVIGGFEDGTFRSSAPVSRAQFTKMLDGTLGIAVYDTLPAAPFLDLGEDVASLYPRDYVSAAYYQGLVRGYPQGLFRPWGKVSRMQVVTMLVRAAQIYLPNGLAPLPSGWTGATSGFSDPDHGRNVQSAEYNGLLAGIDLSGWDVTAPATRGEAVQLLMNLMRLHGPLFASGVLLGVCGPPEGSSAGAAAGAPPKAPIGNIVFDGDSLTAGSTATDPYPSQLMRRFRPGVEWANLGIGGQRLKDMLDRAPDDVDPLYDSRLGQNVVVVWGGTNDMRHWNHSPATVYSRLREYCLSRRQMGYTVVVLTLLPRSDGDYPANFEADRQAVNRSIRATWPGFADAMVDVGSDQLIGRQGSELDRRFFSGDRVHLNDLGLSVVAGRVGQLLKRLDTLKAGPTW
ncbi:MAG: GDSL-type esterase/lipase family protein [bacterium]